MSQASTKTLASLPRGALRIVLFGMPDAGKSSLLGALAQAAQTQEHVLHGHLTDKSQALTDLQRRLYEDSPRQTLEEVAPFPITLQPAPAKAGDKPPEPLEAVLIDCDGRVANEFLSRQRSLNGTGNEGALAQAILDSDTLILVVDASANPEVIKRDFAAFARFLRLLEQSRSQRAEVGGFPVYLVLTKCDLLLKKGDTAITWMERIEEHKRSVDRKFQEFLAQQAAREANPFGKIELHLWATAVKRPALGETPAKPREPYGVAELFRQCLESANVFRDKRNQASQRLRWAVAGLGGFVGFLMLLGLSFWATRPKFEVSALQNDIRIFKSAQGDSPAEHFREPLDDKIKQLKHFQSDPAFADVEPEFRKYVVNYEKELEAYRLYDKELGKVRNPKYVQNDDELNKLVQTLSELSLPAQYADEWKETPAGQLRAQWQNDAEVLRREVDQAEAKYNDLRGRLEKLDAESFAVALRKFVELQKEAAKLPYRDENKKTQLMGSQNLTYENVLQFERVARAREQWEEARRNLKNKLGG